MITIFFNVIYFFFFSCLLIVCLKISGFELPLVACCGYGGIYNYGSGDCGETVTINGSQIFVGSCEHPSIRVNWDGGHYTEVANKFIFNQISSGLFSDSPTPLKMACYNI